MVGAAPTPLVGWIILLAPLAAAVLIQVAGVPRRRLSATLAIAGLLCSFVGTVWLLLDALGGRLELPASHTVAWIALPHLSISFGVLIDRLSLLMALVVSGVGSAIFIYSVGYMAEERAASRYFGMLSLFAFAMLTIVLAGNWIQLFMGWELVGFCSYMLIGHWYAKPAAAEAGKKAFMVNRVADFGFLLGILWLWVVSSPLATQRTFDFTALQARLPTLLEAGLIPAGALAAIGLLLFCGVVGKSAQFPLHVWLPDAMEGPTPVSALIHAATMVAAGVYLLCRTFWFFADLPTVLMTIAWIGAITALLTACFALTENDLKRILAFSTLSQLGYMVMALGLGGAIAGMYHLTTHAFFKALLFLAAGSVIHSTQAQDIRKLGGLRRSMPWTSLAFLIGALALAGFPGLSGFFSKDEILVLAYEHHRGLYVLGTATAGLTAFYIARTWFVAFCGPSQAHGHESPPVMVVPLLVLAVLSVAAGYLGIPALLGQHHPFDFAQGGVLSGVEGHHAQFHWEVAAVSTAVVATGLGLAWLLYVRRAVGPQQLVRALALPSHIFHRRLFIDEFYTWYVTIFQQRVLAGACALFERFIVIGMAVNGTAALARGCGFLVRRFQTGKIQFYVLGFVLGVVLLLAAVVS